MRAEALSVLVISSMGKSPQEIMSSFIFDEAFRLAKRGVNVHAQMLKVEENSISYGINFHGLRKKVDAGAIPFFVRNIPLYPLNSILREPKTLYWENLCAMNAVRTVNLNHIELIHAHFAYKPGVIGYLTKGKLRKPLAITVHGFDILVNASVGYGVRLNKRVDEIITKALNSANCVFAPSTETYNEVRKIVVDSGKIHLLPNGVDTTELRPSADATAIKKKLDIKDAVVVSTLRAHEPVYGLEYFIRAAKIVLSEKRNVVFVIGGDGSLRGYHETLATDLGIRDKVLFLGAVPRNERLSFYSMTDIFVVPSIQEAFGLAVSEAMACGKPVIGSKVGGIPDQITDSKNGFLVEPRDAKAIADKIIWLIDNPDSGKRFGAEGRKIVESKFDLDKRIDRIIEVYRRLAF